MRYRLSAIFVSGLRQGRILLAIMLLAGLLTATPPRAVHAATITVNTTADENGRFSFAGVAPGSYRLYAWVEPLTGVLADSEFLKRFQSQAASVTVKEDDRLAIDVTLLKPEESKAQ